ncbi:MAG: histidine utilization repressor [Desulfobacter sp.]|nr:histidine utilization repressor [Desulfobacter sp.]WDP86923.1 MAG: histidine utilization repressor [Desulfobacter sp.]
MIKPERSFALYERIKQSVIKDIESGKLKPDDRIPSETQLAKTFNASRMTANRALKELTEENRILRVQGVGTFVARPKPEASLFEIKSIAREIKEWGGEHCARILALESKSLGPEIAGKMKLESGDKVFHSILLHLDRGVPVQYSERYVNPKVAPLYLEQDFTQITPSDYLLEIAPLQEAEHVIEAVQPDPDLRQTLEIGPQEPCLCLTRRTWSFDRVATYSRLVSPGSRFTLKGRFKR